MAVGVNLLRDSEFIDKSKDTFSATVAAQEGSAYDFEGVPSYASNVGKPVVVTFPALAVGQTYTFSYLFHRAYASKTMSVTVGDATETLETVQSSAWQLMSITFMATEQTTSASACISSTPATTNWTCNWKHFKLEVGDTATEWTPHPSEGVVGFMAKYLNGDGLSHLMTKLKAWAAATFAPLTHTHDYTKTRVKGNAESSYRTGDVNLTPANIGAIKVSETGNTQQLKRPSWLQGANDVTIDGKINTLRANRLAFLPADQIIIEKTTDGGVTWEDAGVSDATKLGLFSETRNAVYLPLLNGKKNANCGIRITITGMKYDVPANTPETSKYNYWNKDYVLSTERYCQLKEMYFWCSVSGGAINAKVERATGKAPNNWVVIFNDTNFNMTGYLGNDYLSFSQGVFGGSTTQNGNYWNYRMTFMTDDVIPAAPHDGYSQSLVEIRGYGDAWWTAPNEYMANDKLYAHDAMLNAIFPTSILPKSNGVGSLGGSSKKWQNVYATNFYGALSGNATTATTADKLTGFQSRSASLGWGNQTGDVITCMNDSTGGSMGFRKDNPVAGQMSMVIDGTIYVKEGQKKVLDESYLPISVANGGTGATTATDAWTALGGGAIGKKASLAASDIPAHASTATTYGAASTSNYGHAKLSSATDSTSEALAATPKAVKAAYDLATTASNDANSAMSAATGALVFKITYSISNGNIVGAAHVYSAGAEVTSDHADSCFAWSYRIGTGSSVSLGTGKTKTVAVTTLDLGGSLKCDFTPES